MKASEIMDENPLRKKLRTSPEFNPFNDKYDINTIKKFLHEEFDLYSKEDENEKLLQTSLNTLILSPIFIESYKFFKKAIIESKLSFEEMLQLLISIGNRDYLIISKTINKGLKTNNELHLTDVLNVEIKSLDKSIGNINAIFSSEAIIDSLNVCLNFLKNFSENKRIEFTSPEINSINCILNLYTKGNIFSGIKDAYDECIWNNGYVEKIENVKRLNLKFFNERALKLKYVGNFRFQRNIFSFTTFYDQINENTLIHIQESKLKIKIKSVSYVNNYIKYELCDGIDEEEHEWEFRKFCEILAFYPFIDNVNFPKDKKLTLFKVLIIFNLIQHLINKVIKLNIVEDENINLSYFNKYLFKIRKNDLLKYLEKRSSIPTKSISNFLNYLENIVTENNRLNFWQKPLIFYNGNYYFPLTSILHPLVTYMCDNWLEFGGFELKNRGPYLERYLRNEIKETLLRKKYFFEIPSRSRFYVKNKFEEIDLVIELKKIIIIAEVKCIKYPLSSRDYYNSEKVLRNAAIQIERKEKFLKENSINFKEDIRGIEVKKIVKLIITNYPFFTGIHFKGIPVVDLFLVESYFKAGKISNVKFTYDNNEVAEEELSEIIFYNNEDEFNDNFESHMLQPAAIKQLEDGVQIQNIKISPEFFDIEIFKSVPKFKDSSN